MPKKNAYLEKQRAVRRRYLEIGLDVAWQQFWDLLCITLHDPEVMKKDTYGKERLLRLQKAMAAQEKRYRTAFSVKKEADYYQEKLDAALREIFGDDTIPFCDRYPDIAQLDYTKEHRDWKDLY